VIEGGIQVIDWWSAIWIGIVGGIAMSLMMALARAMGLVNASIERYEGCMITGKDEGGGTKTAGFVMHLMISAIIGIIYAWGFAQFWGEATWALGLLGGLIHWLIGGMLLPMMDGMNRCVRDGRIEGFGAFGSKRGAMMLVGLLMGHLLYGLVVGWLYNVPLAA
jgi:hypothetical protein